MTRALASIPAPIRWDLLDQPKWERIPPHGELKRREPDMAWHAFAAYRTIDRHQRTYVELAKQIGKSPQTIREWASRWHWRTRIDAYDAMLDEEAKRAQVEAIKEMNDRQARTAMAMFRAIGQRLVGDEVAGVAAIDPGSLNASDLAKLAAVAAKIEREARESESVRLGTDTMEPPTKVKLAFEITPTFPADTPRVAPPIVDGTALMRGQLDPPPSEDDELVEEGEEA